MKDLLNGLGSEAGGANPASFVDASLMQDSEKEGFFQQKAGEAGKAAYTAPR